MTNKGEKSWLTVSTNKLALGNGAAFEVAS